MRTLDLPDLLNRARRFGLTGDYQAAAAFQYWAVIKSGTEQYDLACYLARLGQRDAAFYWLQVAALNDGVDPGWAGVDEDLDQLHRDARWSKVRAFLSDCNSYWTKHGQPVTVLLTPDAYDRRTPVPTLVWLHGSNSHPDPRRQSGAAPIATAASRISVAVVGVSGPVVFGKAKFSWSEDPERDYRRITDALADVSDRLTVDPAAVIPIGFSQGGQVALEVAARHPETFAGAIAFAPGAGRGRLAAVPATPTLAERGFVIVCGARDAPARGGIGKTDAGSLQRLGARVDYQVVPGLGHAVPPDAVDRLSDWIQFVRRGRGTE